MLVLLLRAHRPEYALLTAAAAGLFLFFRLLDDLLAPLLELREMLCDAGVELSCFTVACKALGVCYLAQFVADLCRDFGQTSLAGRVELAGKCAVLALSLPLLRQLLELSISFLR